MIWHCELRLVNYYMSIRSTFYTPDDKLKDFATNLDTLEAENKKLKQQLEEEKERSALAEKYSSPSRHLSNGPDQSQYIEDIKSMNSLAEF